MKAARDMMTYVTINAMSMVAANPRFYTAVAKSMMAVAQAKYGNGCFSVLRKVFLKRRVISGVKLINKNCFCLHCILCYYIGYAFTLYTGVVYGSL
jgi:hypothetical protein